MKVLVKENKGNFIKKFTVNPNYVSGCNYQIDILEGCPYNCFYCFLKHFLRNDDLIYYKNIEKLEGELVKNKYDYFNLSVLSDGSMLHKKPEILKRLFDILEKFPEKRFEIRFKNGDITNILKFNPPKNIVFTATITPEIINQIVEKGTSNVFDRLSALKKFQGNGYDIGMVFDPIILYKGYLKDYEKIAVFINENFNSVFLFGFGMLRLEKNLFVKFLADINRTSLKGKLHGEFYPGEDQKYRYPYELRIKVYKKLKNILTEIKVENIIYYMEKGNVKEKLLS
ncbi:hypothetical protein J7L48_01260 [bacterium]|nr:hypothetical protein [bacterium]